jgi:two-component system OmpR family sensor kinase
MRLSTRIAFGAAVIIALTIVILGVTMVRATRTTLVAEIDDRLRDSLHRAEVLPGPWDDDGPGRRSGHGDRWDDDLTPVTGTGDQDQPVLPTAPDADDAWLAKLPNIGGSNIAVFVFGPNGRQIVGRPSGYSDAPDSPPSLPQIPGPQAKAMQGKIVTLPSVDGTVQYRVLLQSGPRNATFVTAASLRPVESAVNMLVRTLALAGAAALAGASLLTWAVIRHDLKPVDRMVETAAAIAEGDLSRRVPDADPDTELGRLGAALNNMLTQIEDGIRQRDAAEARLRRFVADAAHELRTPLTSLRGYAELYRQGALPTTDAVTTAMGRIESEGARMARLVDDLLLLARTDQGRALEKEPVDLVRLAREAAGDFAAADPERQLDRDLEGSAVVVGDPIRLRQVIDNLLTNVRIHTPAGTPARVSVRSNGEWAEVTVADSGPGIPVEDQARIFERFWRGDPSRGRSAGGGSGLGLSIVDSLVHAHGGEIAVESSPGQGAAFTLRLPLAPVTAEAIAA